MSRSPRRRACRTRRPRKCSPRSRTQPVQTWEPGPAGLLLRSSTHADNQPADPQGSHHTEEEARDPRSEVREGSQEEGRRAPAPWRLHARLHDDAEEAELGAAQGRACPADERDGGRRLHSGRGPQSSGALRRARSRRSRQGPPGLPLQGHSRDARCRRRVGPQEGPLAVRRRRRSNAPSRSCTDPAGRAGRRSP